MVNWSKTELKLNLYGYLIMQKVLVICITANNSRLLRASKCNHNADTNCLTDSTDSVTGSNLKNIAVLTSLHPVTAFGEYISARC